MLDEMLDDPRNGVRPPRVALLRSAAALICTVALLVAFAIGARYAADNWRQIIYGQTASSHVVTPEDGFPVVGNDMARLHGAVPLRAAEQA
jgi:hypothetical protein